MIYVNTTEISVISIGSGSSAITPNQIDVGNTKVWPAAAPETTLSISPTTITINPGDSSQGYINVTTNASSWNVASSDFGTLSVTKYSSTQVFWTVGNNNTTSNRNFTITVTAGDKTAQATVLQYPGYVIYVVGGSDPRSMTNTGGSVAIRIVSQYGSSNQPITVTTSQSWCTSTYSSVDNTSHTYTYYLTFARNDGAERNVTITFAQTTGGHSTGIMFTQAAAAADIPGLISIAKYGNWVLGMQTVSSTTIAGQSYPVNAILLLTRDTLTSTVTVNFDITVERSYNLGNPPVLTEKFSTFDSTADYCSNTKINMTFGSSNTYSVNGVSYYGGTVVLPNVVWNNGWSSSPGNNTILSPQPAQLCNAATIHYVQ